MHVARMAAATTLALAAGCEVSQRSPRASTDAASAWFDVVAAAPDHDVRDPEMRQRIERSPFPWKVRDRTTGIEMVLVLPGEFIMGSPASETGRADDEGPPHRVRLTRAFYLGTTEVTQDQWQRLMGPTASFFSGPDLPIDPSLRDVESFFAMANKDLPAGTPPLRLPTEAEWEYACRAGTEGPWHFDPPIDHTQINFNDGVVEHAVVVDGRLKVQWRTPPSTNCRMRTTVAGSLAANPWGLHDMHGSLWEWCADRYDPNAYAGRGSITIDPFEPPGDEDLRVLRGGSWYDRLDLCRSAARDRGGPAVRSNRIGVRIARSVFPEPQMEASRRSTRQG